VTDLSRAGTAWLSSWPALGPLALHGERQADHGRGDGGQLFVAEFLPNGQHLPVVADRLPGITADVVDPADPVALSTVGSSQPAPQPQPSARGSGPDDRRYRRRRPASGWCRRGGGGSQRCRAARRGHLSPSRSGRAPRHPRTGEPPRRPPSKFHGLTDPPVQLLALAPLAMSTLGASDRSLLAPAMRSMVVRP
jgi:hypothetical protein